MRIPPPLVRLLRPALRVLRVVLTSRRQLNLPRWIRGRTFGELHGSVVAWLDSHLATVEHGAPWLHRVGTDVWDYCRGEVRSPFDFSLAPRFRASAGCGRQVIAVYGFDGDLTERLGQLAEALSAAGWERIGPLPMRAWADADRYALLSWQPNAVLDYPLGVDGTPPWGRPTLSPHMRLSWTSSGQATRLRQDPNRNRSDTRNYQSVESSDSEYWKLPDSALERYDHTLAVHLDLSYYSNPDALARRHRIPRHLLPTPPTR